MIAVIWVGIRDVFTCYNLQKDLLLLGRRVWCNREFWNSLSECRFMTAWSSGVDELSAWGLMKEVAVSTCRSQKALVSWMSGHGQMEVHCSCCVTRIFFFLKNTVVVFSLQLELFVAFTVTEVAVLYIKLQTCRENACVHTALHRPSF